MMPTSEHDGDVTNDKTTEAVYEIAARAQALADERTKLVAVLRAIRDEDWSALDLSARDREAVRLSQGEADYLVIDAMKLVARRALEDIGEFG